MATVFTAMLSTLYDRLGEEALLEAVDGSAPRNVRVKFDLQGGEMLDGGHLADQPTLRIAASAMPNGLKRGDAFTIGGIVYKAREDGTRLNDGAEFIAALQQVRVI